MQDPSDTPPQQSIVSRFLNFDSMIGPSLIKLIYFIGLIGIALYALILVVTALGMASYSPIYAVGGLIGAAFLVVFGTMTWRLSCELWIVLFKIYERLNDIRDRLPPK